MKTLTTIAFLLASTASYADGKTGDEAYSKASGAFSAATGALVIGQIEVDNGIGIGTGNIGGHQGFAVKIGKTFGALRLGVGAYRIEDGQSGYAASLSWEW